jgi:hypothetical protein
MKDNVQQAVDGEGGGGGFVDMSVGFAVDFLREADMVVLNRSDYDMICSTCPAMTCDPGASIVWDLRMIVRIVLVVIAFLFIVRAWKAVAAVRWLK